MAIEIDGDDDGGAPAVRPAAAAVVRARPVVATARRKI
jgi:hypothetical protein